VRVALTVRHADAVAALTKDSRLPAEQRETAYDRQLSAAASQARPVKLADIDDNYCDKATQASGPGLPRRPSGPSATRAGAGVTGAIEIVRRLIAAD